MNVRLPLLLLPCVFVCLLAGCQLIPSASGDDEPIWMAMARAGHVTSVRHYADQVNQPLPGSQYPLAVAYQERHRLAFATLLKAGATPDTIEIEGQSLFCAAAADFDPFYLNALLTHQPDPAWPEPYMGYPESTVGCAEQAGRTQNALQLINAQHRYQRPHPVAVN
ncbi:hypothetical protein KUV56_11490 [Ferrimonas balearica]|uniref:hypothetical protein n=1 Tax=Ferrimonas balearica TaxID=44012 RepID=UPI001C58A2E5|nr:hypothetical protein [Ferrimonas balearica]MBW3140133.1 hypothetical protein [Ferrimonas balearica]MBY6106759.1 hypothetical protein [Ferrimonas balearica]